MSPVLAQSGVSLRCERFVAIAGEAEIARARRDAGAARRRDDSGARCRSKLRGTGIALCRAQVTVFQRRKAA